MRDVNDPNVVENNENIDNEDNHSQYTEDLLRKRIRGGGGAKGMELLGSCSTAELSMRARLPATVPTVISGDGVRSARVLLSSTVMSTSVLRANQTGREHSYATKSYSTPTVHSRWARYLLWLLSTTNSTQ